MFHFDSPAGVLAQNQVTIPIQPSGMAVMPSGKTIIVGTHSNDPGHPDDRKYGLAILDEDDKLLRSVDLPLPPGRGGLLLVHAWWWETASRM